VKLKQQISGYKRTRTLFSTEKDPNSTGASVQKILEYRSTPNRPTMADG